MSLKFGKLYDKKQIDFQGMLYPTKAMIALLVPIVIEQLLNSFMGMVDTMMVSNVGSEAISAVSLVDSINNLVIQVFSAMATGAAIICSQYLGNRDENGCNRGGKTGGADGTDDFAEYHGVGTLLPKAAASTDLWTDRAGGYGKGAGILSDNSFILSVSCFV